MTSSSSSPRRLHLGSASSLSFEEEEADWGQHGASFFDEDSEEESQPGRRGLHSMLTDLLTEQVEVLLSKYFSPTSKPHPSGLRRAMDAVVHDALIQSEEEPYGIRGATMKVRLANGKETVTLGSVVFDSNTVSTFNLILTLSEEHSLAVALKNWLGLAIAGGYKVDRVISQRYTLRKEKLYRSSSGATLASMDN